MGKPSEEDMREFREDMLQDDYNDQYYEKKMHSDEDYCILQFEDQILEAQEILNKVSKCISNYGHQVSVTDLAGL